MSDTERPRAANELIKARSDYLRGTIADGLRDPLTGAIGADDGQLLKFHGSYQQDDHDLWQERLAQKLEPLYSFMIRLRMPGGVCSPQQWQVLDALAGSHANGTLRLTTRQTIQYHGVLKPKLRDTIYQVNQILLDTLAACGDVNRNVMCSVVPETSHLHAQVQHWATRISAHLLPQSGAYHEIWLGAQRVAGSAEQEPLYGQHYLPRKFKMALAVPPRNDVDVYANDVGFIAIEQDGRLAGFNVTAGGGLGRTHGEPATWPRLGDVLGFCLPEQSLAVAEQLLCIQRDHGDRSDRKHARLKYTIEDHGLEWLHGELARRLGWRLQAPRPFRFEHSGDSFGWVRGTDDRWHYTLFVENGRIADWPDYPLRTALREIAGVMAGDMAGAEDTGTPGQWRGEFRLTGNQNIVLAGIDDAARPAIEALLARHGLDRGERQSPLRRASMACVALPTCGLAMAEAERYLPRLASLLEDRMRGLGLQSQPIMVRMTGCPNGCARPYLGEIGLVGKSPGHYQLWLGASRQGDRLAQRYAESLDEQGLLDTLGPMLERYAAERHPDEAFGDFVTRAGYVDNPLTFDI